MILHIRLSIVWLFQRPVRQQRRQRELQRLRLEQECAPVLGWKV